MAQQALNNLGLNNNWNTGSSGWKAGMDNDLLVLDGLVQPNVATRTLTVPPGSPDAGDRYLIPHTGATGVWGTGADQYAVWSNSAWVLVSPLIGWSVFVLDENRWVTWTGTAWVVRGMRESALSCRVAASAAGVLVLDVSQGACFDVTLTASIATLTLQNPVAAPNVTRVHLRLTQGGSGGFTMALPAGGKTVGGAGYTPTAAPGAVDLLTLTSYNGGGTWYLEASKGFA